MADDDQFESGVVSVFEAIASDRKPADSSKPRPAKRQRPSAPPTPPTPVTESTAPAATLRTGRFPGSKNGPPKLKITARIPVELRTSYVEWALDDRCTLSELIERAMTEFYQRQRASAKSDK